METKHGDDSCVIGWMPIVFCVFSFQMLALTLFSQKSRLGGPVLFGRGCPPENAIAGEMICSRWDASRE
jgi:hypothetical protein